MPVFPWPLPLQGYAGLGVGLNEIKGAVNYVREPITIELTDDGVTAANLDTQEWPTAMSEWGPISSVLVYDAPTGGNLLFEALLAGDDTPYSWGDYSAGLYSPTTPSPLIVHMYDRPRISASSLTVATVGGIPLGWGRGAFGRNAYGTTPQAFHSANAVINTFGATYPCSAGSWAPGPWARAA